MPAKMFILCLTLALTGCGGDEAPSSTPVVLLPPTAVNPPSPTPAPAPVPSPAPVTPTPAPSPILPPPPVAQFGDGKIVVVTEGDSIAVTWGGNHTGMYRDSRSDIEFHGLAVGGSGLSNLSARVSALLALKPDLVSVHIGANDLASFPNAEAYAEALKIYVDRIRASGAKVVITTVLPRQTTSNRDTLHNIMRKELAGIIKAASWVDGVADFGADDEMGPDNAPLNRAFYSDGLHPTDGTQGVGEGGQRKLFRVFKPVMDRLAADFR